MIFAFDLLVEQIGVCGNRSQSCKYLIEDSSLDVGLVMLKMYKKRVSGGVGRDDTV